MKILHIIIVATLFLSCSRRPLDNVKSREVVYSFVTDLLTKKYNLKEAVKQYFFNPNEILSEKNSEAFILYEININQFLEYLRDEGTNNSSSYEVIWNNDILSNQQFFWILDTVQCEETLLFLYTDNLRENKFCSCFKEGKIYSIFPMDADGKVAWTRIFKLVEE